MFDTKNAIFSRNVLPLNLGVVHQERGDGEMMRSVIGRLSVLLLDGYLDEAEANPAISGPGEEYQHHLI